MSMRDYAFEDYGLILDIEDTKLLAEKFCEDFSEEDWEENQYEYAYKLYEQGELGYIGEFTGEGCLVSFKGYDEWDDTMYFSVDTIYYVPLEKAPSLFCQQYTGIDEVVQEFKSKLGEYLPENFDYARNFRHIIGTYFG